MDKRRMEAFQVLGIPANSDQATVVHAYRRLARATHPDVSADPEAADRFATLAAAYRLASQPPATAEVSAPEWSIPVATTPSRRHRQGVPIIAGPVLIRPAPRTNQGAVGRG
jgi:hypothetical protein